MTSQKVIAELAGVSRPDVSNYMADRQKFVSPEKRRRIQSVIERGQRISKTQMVLDWLKTGNTITPQQSLAWFGLHALSQTVTKLRMRGYDIQNIAGRGRDGHNFAIYKMEESK